MAWKSNALLLVALLFLCQDICAQDTLRPVVCLAIDAGFHFHNIQPVSRPYLRGDLPSSGFLSQGIGGQLVAQFAGVKGEKLFFQQRFGLSAGLRYINIFSNFYRNSLVPNYFYVLHRQEGTTTEYLRLIGLEENLYYLGIPLEARLYVNPKRRWYVMAGGEWGYRIARKVSVTFKDPGMKTYSADVKALVQGASENYASLHIGAGVRLGRERPRWALGMNVPIAMTTTVSSLTTPRPGGVGMQILYLLSKSRTWYEKD